MPTYTYRCDRCKRTHEEVRPIASRAYPEGCPRCELGYLQLIPSPTAGNFPGADHWRTRMRSRGEGF
jgi:putative FmdB family regulatory protein